MERGRGVATLDFDADSGALTVCGFTPGIANPSYLAVHPDSRVLYAVHELVVPGVALPGRLSAFHIEDRTLRFLNDVSSEGEAPCHLSVDPAGRSVLVAHYTSGSVVTAPLNSDGSVASVGYIDRHRGPSHVHMVAPGPDGRFVYSSDLGADAVFVYPRDEKTGRLGPAVRYPSESGAGPRHFAFSHSGKHFYLVCEKSGTIEVSAVDCESGALTRIQTVATVPADETRPAGCGAIRLSPDGRFLYASNRLGVDTLVAYEVEGSGRLGLARWYPSGGQSPRDFVFDPTGRFVLVALQGSGLIRVFRFDPRTGDLTDTGHSAAVPTVTSLVFSS